jgi:lipoprotein-anchoring transpeptidase ErfK/SrfK
MPFSIDHGWGYVSHIQIDLSDRRLTLYQNTTPLQVYPVAVGREGWTTPTGSFQVMQMYENPDWMNPLTGGVIAGGDPSNPLGQYWIGFWTDGNNWIGLHGTPDPSSIGQAISHGCVRLHNHHIQEIFHLVQVGTQVIVSP